MSPDEIIAMQFCLETRLDADMVLATMRALITKSNVVTVQELHDLLGMESTYKDAQQGWDDLESATVEDEKDGGFMLNLPGPKALS